MCRLVMRRIGILLGCLFVSGSADMVLAQDASFAVGGGFVRNTLRADGKSELEGLFATFNVVFEDLPSFMSFSLSSTDVDEGTITTEVTRIGFAFGGMLRRDAIIRPVIFLGLAVVQAEVTALSTTIFDKTSIGLFGGVGVEVGKGHHAFYASASYDPFIKFDVSFPQDDIDATLIEFHSGYLYRF